MNTLSTDEPQGPPFHAYRLELRLLSDSQFDYQEIMSHIPVEGVWVVIVEGVLYLASHSQACYLQPPLGGDPSDATLAVLGCGVSSSVTPQSFSTVEST